MFQDDTLRDPEVVLNLLMKGSRLIWEAVTLQRVLT